MWKMHTCYAKIALVNLFEKHYLKRDMSEAIHSSAAMLHKVGVIDKTTMLDFDARHLVPSESTVGKWESGANLSDIDFSEGRHPIIKKGNDYDGIQDSQPLVRRNPIHRQD